LLSWAPESWANERKAGGRFFHGFGGRFGMA
jgi:hypothetical protein